MVKLEASSKKGVLMSGLQGFLATCLKSWAAELYFVKNGQENYGATRHPYFNSRHRFALPLSETLQEELLAKYPAMRGLAYLDFLACYNGAQLYDGKVTLFGFGKMRNPPTSFDASLTFDIGVVNVEQRSLRENFNGVVIGYSRISGEDCYILECADKKIRKVDQASLSLSRTYDSLIEFFGDLLVYPQIPSSGPNVTD